MRNYALLQKRPTGYYFRQIVPLDLREIVGKREIVKSLHTKDIKEASRKHQALALEYDNLFQNIRHNATERLITLDIQIPTSSNLLTLPRHLISHTINATDKGLGKTLIDVWEKWSQEKAENYKTKEAGLLAIKRFENVHGCIKVGTIEAGHLVEFKEWLITQQEFKGRTKNKQIEIIKSLVSFAHSNNWIKANPLFGLKIKVPENDSQKYLPFDADELSALFLCQDFRELRKTQPEYYWIMLIALFTGARMEEICQLLIGDIKEKNGVWYFDINEFDERKSLKTDSSRRVVPIHRTLINLGIIDYVQSAGNETNAFLFPRLKPYRGKRSHCFSKSFGRFKLRQGITSGRKVFHSFRHTFKDMCREAEMPKEVHHRLTGHNSSEVGDMYGTGFSITKLNDYIQRVVLPITLGQSL